MSKKKPSPKKPTKEDLEIAKSADVAAESVAQIFLDAVDDRYGKRLALLEAQAAALEDAVRRLADRHRQPWWRLW